MDHLDVNLDGWVIADGIARELCVGQIVDFGLWFYATNLRRAERACKHVDQVAYENYRISGEVLARTDDGPSALWTIDFGIIAFSTRAPAPAAVQPGSYVTGDFRLQFDPGYFWDNPPVADGSEFGIYRWRIEQILAKNWSYLKELAEHRLLDGTSRLVGQIDESSITYREVKTTDGGDGAYLLRCRRVG